MGSTYVAQRRLRLALFAVAWSVVVFFFATSFLARADEAKARALAERAYPTKKIEAFRRLPDLPFYEIWIDRTLIYTDLDARVLMIGNFLDARTLASVSDARRAQLVAIKPSEIPRETILKFVNGRGEQTIYVFADPLCAYCKSFEKELRKVQNVTVYTVLYPVLGPESLTKARHILCSSDPAAAWRAWMDEGREPQPAPSGCDKSFEKILQFGRDREVAITPTTIYADGTRVTGHTPVDTVNFQLLRAKSKTR